MQPINYLLSGQSPFEALMGGMDGFQKYDNNKLVLEQNRIANQAAQDKADYIKLAQQEAQTLDYNDPNAIRQFIAKYESTGLTKGMTNYVANLDEKERQGLLADTSKAISLLRSGDSANAAQLARERALAYKNAGNPTKAADYEKMAAIIEAHPNAALQSLQMSYAITAGKDDMKGYKDYMDANAPQVKEFSAGGETGAWIRDPYTGEVTYQKLTDNSISPGEQLKADTDIATTGMNNDTSRYTSDNSLKGTMYSSDNSRAASQYSADKSYQGTVYSQTEQTKRFNAEQQNQMNQSEVKEVGGYMMRVYKNGRVDVLGKAQPKQDASTLGKVADIQSMNDSANQTIAQLKKAKELSRQGIYSGYGASGRADVMGFVGGTEQSKRTQEYTNIIVNSALQSLKAVFGAAPTEGERAMLIKVQASADYPQEVREKILDQAIEMAQAKIASNNRQIATLTGQQPSYPQASAPPTGIAKPQQSQGGYISGKYK